MQQLYKQNKSWFRPLAWYYNAARESREEETMVIFTGEVAPPTKIWKLAFVVWMMVLNTLLQGVLAGMMWGYNRITRPRWQQARSLHLMRGYFVCWTHEVVGGPQDEED